tara:strand:+ start:4634 stop:6052 length:1419 start_codon:yes stop_codon:yes gene_type:complete
MSFEINNICCIGAGYVGGPTMSVIADKCPNLTINVVDINQQRIDQWNQSDLSQLPIYEPGLKEIVSKCRNKNLYFSIDIEKHIKSADMIFISVNTPTKVKGIGAGQASDLKWIEASAREIAKFAEGKTIVIEKSTLPVKTAAIINKILQESNTEINNSDREFFVLSNPEFLAEGTAINDLNQPDRVLIGGDNQEAIDALKNLYLNWVDENKILTSNIWSSELSKLIANAFLAQRISSINSISALCEATGADIKDVSLAVGMDSRIGNKFLESGPGFGGSCFKKDILNLVYICKHHGLDEVASYWQKVIDMNFWQQKRLSEIIISSLFGTISEKKIAILGFAFKANTNDTRESPAIKICRDLLEEGGNLQIYDPRVSKEMINHELQKQDENIKNNNDYKKLWKYCESVQQATYGVDAVLILTEWEEFKNIKWQKLSKSMRSPKWLFDTRSITDIEEAKSAGINTWRLGNSEAI